MSFKLEHKNKHGSFKIKLKREVSTEEMNELCQLASNLVPSEPTSVVGKPTAAMGYPGPYSDSYINQNARVYGPQLPPGPVVDRCPEFDFTSQTRLGEKPVSEIKMGTYHEPDEGVRIKFVHFVEQGKVPVFKIVRDATGISLLGVKEIVYGNYPCPRLTLETAQHILEELRKLSPPVFAKIVPGTDAEAA
jgi:hypothetical protein